MSAKVPLWKKGLIPLGCAAGFVIMLGLSNHQLKNPYGGPIIYDQQMYGQVLDQARTLTDPIFKAYDKGEELTEAQKADLRKAAVLYDSANTFDPIAMEPYFSAGKCYQMLGDYPMADARLRQLVYNKIYNPTEAGKATVIEAENILSTVEGFEGDWKKAFTNADDAVKAHPDSPVYRTTRASAELQLGQTDDAERDIQIALTLDPTYKRAQELKKLMGSGSETAKAAKS